ncbi:MAG: hypothetical protein IJB74_09930 [Clostridia bacterium]|nr:hypothetical protein [Clostridia bacterium]
MNMLSALKCLLYLIKCSKYLYYIKKAVCITFIAIAVFAGITLFSGNGSPLKKLKEMM